MHRPNGRRKMPQTIRLASIPGDGIGPEVIAEALKVLDAALPEDVSVDLTEFHLGAGRFLETGDVLPDEELEAIKQHDAILLGAVGGVPGDPRLAGANIERGLLLKLRFELDHYLNRRRPVLRPGVVSPLAGRGDIDFVVVREGTEGPYVGNGGSIRVGTPAEVATEVSLNTAFGVERLVRDAFARAQARRKKLTLVHKTNVIVNAGKIWTRLVAEVGAEYPDVSVDYQHVDAMMIHLVNNPSQFDVIVTDNLFGDIITDLAAAISGGIGLAASGNINPDKTTPSMFEPAHGSAPDIAGQAKADPTAAILSAALLLAPHGLPEASTEITGGVEADIVERGTAVRSTPEIG